MTRDEFQEWINEEHDDAVESLPEVNMSLPGWLRHYGAALKQMAAEEQKEASAASTAEVDDEDLDIDDDDDDAATVEDDE